MDQPFTEKLAKEKERVNRMLSEILSDYADIEPGLNDAVTYCLDAPGKRIRGALVIMVSRMLCQTENPDAEIAAAAVEMVHTYSLIHDDLPAMDDDDLRRGRATCHKKFDEATAILTGDALLTMAFEIVAKKVAEPQKATALIRTLSEAGGPHGMVGGQAADLTAASNPDILSDDNAAQQLESIHMRKTAKIISAAAVMGAICGGADDKQIENLRRYGLKVGLGFQIADDILDVSATSEQLGKTAGKDTRSGKLTYPALIGMAESQKLAQKIADEAIDALIPFGPKAESLRQLAKILLNRKK